MLYDEIMAAQDAVADLQQRLDSEKNKLAGLLSMQVGNGVDVSEFQGDINWGAVKGAGYVWAICRVNDGDREDTKYNLARSNAVRGAGLILGAYSFARPGSPNNDNRDAAIECSMNIWFAWRGGALRKGDLPLTYDFENDSIKDLDPNYCAQHLVRWIKAYKHLRNHNPIIYTNRSTIEAVHPHLSTGDKTFVANCPLWIADPSATVSPVVPEPWASAGKSWLIWQLKPKSVPGITTGPADINIFGGSKIDLDALLIK